MLYTLKLREQIIFIVCIFGFDNFKIDTKEYLICVFYHLEILF
ncbi:hypothetical protein D1N84_00215 [Clostridioides difficile]|nr:hypothetical protein CWR56_13565 [Clostridioides difficile]CCL11783.1 Conserved hypothetical protein [Clostridioides difficile E16]CCL15127.1 Conserved hypothetical protein [Clostridioides difficile T22]CCL19144.1 Conserved hypothetical protein [Clostridioides difficile E25]CCL23038.1 Conserved hypothetical protein [Clostridioides difficile T15]CCL61747.1 Conserved hypothetical protein [Clostridioides difficile E9]CCL65752.1 Conserved hypothetical protein [Clostridioides difficile E7]CCL8